MDFYAHVDGEFTRLQDIDGACEQFLKNIKYHLNSLQEQNARLKKENEELKSEAYLNNEIQRLQEELKLVQKQYGFGFEISDVEWKKILDWQNEHDAIKHGWTDMQSRVKAGGAIGGRYKFEFIPTSIGTFGAVVCTKCGEKFTFQEAY